MLRLIFATILLLISLLVIFRAPTNLLWRLSVAVTEYSHVFVVFSILILASTFFFPIYRMGVSIICIVSICLYFTTIMTAFKKSNQIMSEFSVAFPSETAGNYLEQPFSFLKLFVGIPLQKIEVKKFVYKKINDKSLNFDFYPAISKNKAPCVIVIHGGSWAEGSSNQLPDLNYYLSGRGINVAAINYRLAPEFQCPAPIEDTKDVMSYLSKNAEELNIDTTNLILLGRSAGGQIALLTSYTVHNPNIKGVISFYAPADMVYGAQIRANKWVLDTDKVLREYIGGVYSEVPKKYKDSSPIEYVNQEVPPTLIIHGPKDPLVAYEHSVRLNKKLNESRVKNYFLSLPWATHGCDYNINGPSGQITTFAIERFINSVTTH